MGLKFARLKNDEGKPCVKMPERAGKKEAGIDFYVPDNFEKVTLVHGDSILIPMGVKVKLPEVPECLKDTHQYALVFSNKSGVASKKGLVVGACVIDTTYQGELFLNLHNNTDTINKGGKFNDNERIEIIPGEKIVQGILLLVNTEEIEELSEEDLFTEETERGDKGFGSNYKEK